MSQKLSEQKFRELVKKLIIKEMKSKSLKEDYFDDEDENLGIFSGDFDPNEFSGKAKQFAKKDIKAAGMDFEDLGKSKFEKNLNPDEFTADLKRQNLNLPSDAAEAKALQNSIERKKAHDKKFGAGSLNEAGEWADDEEGIEWKESLKGQLELVDSMLTPGLPFFIKDIKGFDKYQGPYAIIEIDDDTFRVWLMENNELWIEGFSVDNTSDSGNRAGFLGKPQEVADIINQTYSILTHMNEEGVNPNTKLDRPKDAEGNPLTLKARVVDLKSKAIGRVIRFGVDDNRKQTVHIEWIQNFGGEIPKTITYPEKIVVRDDTRIVREDNSDTTHELEKAFATAQEEMNYLIYKSHTNQEDAEDDSKKDDLNNQLESFGDKIQEDFDWDFMDNYKNTLSKKRNDVAYLEFLNQDEVEFEKGFNGEYEIEEGIGQSLTIGKSQNAKPGNYPQVLKRVGLKENLDQAKSLDNGEVFLVVNDAFNRAHYRDLIGQTFDDAPAYARVKVIKPEDIEAEREIIYDEEPESQHIQEDDYYLPAEEVEYHNKKTHQEIESLVGKDIKIKNMDYITGILFKNHKRINSILESIKEEIAANRVINNIIAATDNMDTVWIFEIVSIDNNTVVLECTGTAK